MIVIADSILGHTLRNLELTEQATTGIRNPVQKWHAQPPALDGSDRYWPSNLAALICAVSTPLRPLLGYYTSTPLNTSRGRSLEDPPVTTSVLIDEHEVNDLDHVDDGAYPSACSPRRLATRFMLKLNSVARQDPGRISRATTISNRKNRLASTVFAHG